MVKFLEEELRASETKHCDTCKCPNRDMTVLAIIPKTYNIGTQTMLQGDSNPSLCLRCNSNLNSPSRTNSPFTMKLVKSSDSVISETKSSVSDSTQNDKLFTPVKKDDIMVNPILGHHRLCDRTLGKVSTSVGGLLSVNTSPKLNGNVEGGATGAFNVNSLSSDNVSKTGMISTAAPTIADNTPVQIYGTPTTVIPGISTVFRANEKSSSTALLLHSNDVNDSENEDTINEKTSLLGGNVVLSPKSKNNSIASKLLLKSPELMGGAKPRTPEVKSPASSKINDTVSHERVVYDVEKVNSKSESLRGPGNGSTNSLWSRTSSKDGSKIFENFNRNLIKTIKVSEFSPFFILFLVC